MLFPSALLPEAQPGQNKKSSVGLLRSSYSPNGNNSANLSGVALIESVFVGIKYGQKEWAKKIGPEKENKSGKPLGIPNLEVVHKPSN